MPKTLLLADDSVTIQKVVGISFASEDVTLITVDNGDDAMAKAREKRPDVILADVVMPGKNGYEVCEAVKSDPDLRHIPVLLLTGTFEAFDEERARTAGAAGHIAKPFEAQTLVDHVKRLFEESATAAKRATSPARAPAAAEVDGAASDGAFDFFDDDLDEISPSVEPATPDTAPDEGIDLDGPDGAFAFGDDEFDAPDAGRTPFGSPEESPFAAPDAGRTPFSGPEESPFAAPIQFDESPADRDPAVAERTVAILPDDAPMLAPSAEEASDQEAGDTLDTELEEPGFSDTAEDLLAPEPSTPGDALRAPAGAAPDEDFDFHFDRPAADLGAGTGDDSLLPVDSDDLAQATVLDPDGASGYDVSSSDLGDPLAAEPAAPARSAERKPYAAERGMWAPGDADREPTDEAPVTAAPAEPIPEVEPTAKAEPLAAERADMAEPSLAAIAPHLRERLHDSLEKIAWDSFSEVTEKIVRQAVARVEAIAWEVIPQLAEALVREEIRRMKGEIEDPDS